MTKINTLSYNYYLESNKPDEFYSGTLDRLVVYQSKYTKIYNILLDDYIEIISAELINSPLTLNSFKSHSKIFESQYLQLDKIILILLKHVDIFNIDFFNGISMDVLWNYAKKAFINTIKVIHDIFTEYWRKCYKAKYEEIDGIRVWSENENENLRYSIQKYHTRDITQNITLMDYVYNRKNTSSYNVNNLFDHYKSDERYFSLCTENIYICHIKSTSNPNDKNPFSKRNMTPNIIFIPGLGGFRFRIATIGDNTEIPKNDFVPMFINFNYGRIGIKYNYAKLYLTASINEDSYSEWYPIKAIRNQNGYITSVQLDSVLSCDDLAVFSFSGTAPYEVYQVNSIGTYSNTIIDKAFVEKHDISAANYGISFYNLLNHYRFRTIYVWVTPENATSDKDLLQKQKTGIMELFDICKDAGIEIRFIMNYLKDPYMMPLEELKPDPLMSSTKAEMETNESKDLKNWICNCAQEYVIANFENAEGFRIYDKFASGDGWSPIYDMTKDPDYKDFTDSVYFSSFFISALCTMGKSYIVTYLSDIKSDYPKYYKSLSNIAKKYMDKNLKTSPIVYDTFIVDDYN